MDNYNEYLNTTVLARILQLAKSDKAILSISAFHNDLSLEKNREHNDKLKRLIEKAGYGFYEIVGHFIEQDKSELKDESFLITDNRSDAEKLKKFAIKMAEYFDQDSVFYRAPKGDNVLLDNKGNALDIDLGTELSVESFLLFHSKRKDKAYVFECISKYREAMTGFGAALLKSKIDTAIDGTFEDFKNFIEYSFSENN